MDSVEDDFEIIERLGIGSYSTVWKIRYKETDAFFALKHENNIFNDLETCRNILREIRLLHHLQNEGIVKIRDVRTTTSNYNELLIILDLHAIDLKKFINTAKTISEEEIKYIMYELLKTIKYLHSAGVLHRDIKPGNILLSEKGKPVLCDFGLARGSIHEKYFQVPRRESIEEARTAAQEDHKKDETKRKSTRKLKKDLTGYVATRWYRAPEIILCPTNYGPGIDIWALGCVFAELLEINNTEPTQRKPFFPGNSSFPYSPAYKEKLKCGISMHETDQLNVILKTLGCLSREDCEFLEDERRIKLLMEMHREESKLDKRFALAGKDAIDLLKKMLQFNPIMRATVDECLEHNFFADIRDKEDEIVAGSKIDFDFEAKSYLSKERFKELIDEELDHFKELRENHGSNYSTIGDNGLK
jgi:serine/threonine protein kinase